MGLRLQSGEISIHALREEGDLADYLGLPTKVISIHALREEGDQTSMHSSRAVWIFLSTPSARRATRPGISPCCTPKFLSTPSARRATQFDNYSQ